MENNFCPNTVSLQLSKRMSTTFISEDVFCNIVMPFLDNTSLYTCLSLCRSARIKAKQLAEQQSNQLLGSLVQNAFKSSQCLSTLWEYRYAKTEKHGDSDFEYNYHSKNSNAIVVLPDKNHDLSTTHLIPHEVLLRINPNLTQEQILQMIEFIVTPNDSTKRGVSEKASRHLFDWIPVLNSTDIGEQYSMSDICDMYDVYYNTDNPRERIITRVQKCCDILMLVCCRRDSPFWGRIAFMFLNHVGGGCYYNRIYVAKKYEAKYDKPSKCLLQEATLEAFDTQHMSYCIPMLDFDTARHNLWTRVAKFADIISDAKKLQFMFHPSIDLSYPIEQHEGSGCALCQNSFLGVDGKQM